MKTQKHDAIVLSSGNEKAAQGRLAELLKATPLPDDEVLANLGLFLTSKTLSRILFFHEMYISLPDFVVIGFSTVFGKIEPYLKKIAGKKIVWQQNSEGKNDVLAAKLRNNLLWSLGNFWGRMYI